MAGVVDATRAQVVARGVLKPLRVERFDVAKSTEHASELAEAAKRGVSLIVFPEGTLTRNTGLMGFRTGAFQAAVSVTVGAPITAEGTDWAAAVKLRDAVRAEILRHCGEPDLVPADTQPRAA